jgi:hypothetical protein
MVLFEARGLSLLLVIRGGIACMSDSVPKHTGPNALTDTHLEPSVSRTRPITTRENRRRWKGPLSQRRSSFLPMQLCGVEIRSFLQIVRGMPAIFRVRGETRHRRSHLFFKKSSIEIVQRAWVSASGGRSPFEEILLETKAATLLEFIEGLHGGLSVTFEEGTSAVWLHDLLKPHVTHLVACAPRKNALLKDGSKCDRIDAEGWRSCCVATQLTSV